MYRMDISEMGMDQFKKSSWQDAAVLGTPMVSTQGNGQWTPSEGRRCGIYNYPHRDLLLVPPLNSRCTQFIAK